MLACGFNVSVGVDGLSVDMKLVSAYLPNGDVVSGGVVGVVVALLLQRG
jgi:hypothetical protein